MDGIVGSGPAHSSEDKVVIPEIRDPCMVHKYGYYGRSLFVGRDGVVAEAVPTEEYSLLL